MQNRKRLIVLAAVGAGAFALTGTPAAAQAVSEPQTYKLAEVAGAELPAVFEEEDGCREEVLEGTLTLDPNGEWTLVTREREVCGDNVEEEEEQENGRYEIEGDAIRFLDDDDADDDAGNDDAEEDDDADPDQDLDNLAEGTRSADALTVRLDDGETELVFRP